MSVTFGQRLREIRQAAGVTLESVASKLGVSAVYLSDIERDKRNPPRRHMDALVRAISANPEYEAELRQLARPETCPHCGAKRGDR